MHETSLIKFTLEAVERRARELGIRHVSDIYLVVGELRGAIPEQMQAAFQILTAADQSPAPASVADQTQLSADAIPPIDELPAGAATSRETWLPAADAIPPIDELPAGAATSRETAGFAPGTSSNTGLFAGTRLSIDYRPILLRCRACGHHFPATLETYPEASCSSCGAPSPEIISGNELLIDSFRGE